MNQLFRQNLVEALVGAAVLAIAVLAVVFFYERTDDSVSDESYLVGAMFDNASGISVGTDVRVSGITVGKVVASTLETEFPFRARVDLAIDDRYALPTDSSASITSEGLLGGNYIALSPGGELESLRDGDEIMNTQGSVDLLGLVGQFINDSGDEGGSSLDDPADAAAEDGDAS
ncbi:MAG: outer membrane lipid asymmetry maintenance protein MlaD [Pseudomonadota bacterium]